MIALTLYKIYIYIYISPGPRNFLPSFWPVQSSFLVYGMWERVRVSPCFGIRVLM